MSDLSPTQVKMLQRYIEKVEDEGMEYAALNYSPKDATLRSALKIDALIKALDDAENALNALANEHNL